MIGCEGTCDGMPGAMGAMGAMAKPGIPGRRHAASQIPHGGASLDHEDI